ncbi:GNAT family N-acetyltransferase [Salinispirillum marinum]|uniref:GNAT family N-acetyltransferase n=2 Tax=Saccharospirillaceae TaxID=255527 RepID=A0ABV8BBY6_9GAMM
MFNALNGQVEPLSTGQGMVWQYETFAQLSTMALYELLRLRVNVFVVEQQCPYSELDDKDITAWHLQGFLDGRLVAYARILPPNELGCPEIGRVIVAPEQRGSALGHTLMRAAVQHATEAFPSHDIELGAQAHLQGFYQQQGFAAVGEPYDEDGIKHIKMRRANTGR